MKLNFKGRAKQAGFTLIELIVVIVILGIMAATALPKFMDLGADARVAKATAALASVKSVMAMAKGASLAQNGKLDATVSIDGTTKTLLGGAPDADDLESMLDMPDYDINVVAGATASDPKTVTIATDAEHPDCKITYTEAKVDDGDATATPPVLPSLTTAASVSVAPTLASCD